MSRRIVIRPRASSGIMRLLHLLCLLLVLTAISSPPVCSAPGLDGAEIEDPDPANPNTAAEIAISVPPPISDLSADNPEPEDKVLAARDVPSSVLEKISRITKPNGAIGEGRPMIVMRPDTSKTPGRLVAVGLLMIPVDNGLLKLVPRVPEEQKADRFTEAVNKFGSKEVLLASIGGLYLLGDNYDKDTAKLALAALANSVITTQEIKMLAGRERPSLSGDLLKFHGLTLHGEGRQSFPSGHTSAAFAVATVLAKRHPKQKWLYYGLAAAVGMARIRKSAHFPSDVLVGAGIGIRAGNNVLRNGPRILSIKL